MNSTRQKPTQRKGRRTANHVPVRALAKAAVDAMLDKKALDVTVMDMHGVSGVADIFVIGTGESDLQIKAISDGVTERIREQHQERPWHTEGYDAKQWVLLDYVDLVVHVFTHEKRAYYDLERLWGDAPRVDVQPDADLASIEMLNVGASEDGEATPGA